MGVNNGLSGMHLGFSMFIQIYNKKNNKQNKITANKTTWFSSHNIYTDCMN